MGIKFWWPLLFVGAIILICIVIFPSDLKVADLFGKAGKWDEAIQNYQKALEKAPHRNDIRIELASVYLLKNDFKNALTQFELAGADMSNDPIQLTKLYEIYSSMENKDKTVATLEKLVIAEPENLNHRNRLAEAYEWNSDTNKAIELYDELVAEDPDNIKYLNKLVYLNLNKKDFDSAIRNLKQLTILQPENIEARILLGNVYLKTNQKRLAALEYESALKVDPDNESLRVTLADLYLWMPQKEKGIFHYEHLLMAHVLNEQYFDQLLELTKATQPSKAIKYYKFRINHLPNNVDLRESCVEFYIELGYTDEAIEQLQILIKQNPEEIAYPLDLANLYENMREPDLANQLYESSFNMGEQSQEVIDALVGYYKSEQEYEKLLNLYAILVSTNKATPEIFNDYAETSIKTKKFNNAAELFYVLLKKYPQNVKYRIQLANLYQYNGDNIKAIKLVKQGMDDYGSNDTEYLLFAGQFFTSHNYHADAISCFEKLVENDQSNIPYKKQLIAQYIKTRKFNKARDVYIDLLDHEPGNFDYKLELASLYWLQNDFDKMHEINNSILLSAADTPKPHRKIGQFYFERAFYNDAIEHFTIELNDSPTDSLTLQMLGLAYAWNNQPKISKVFLARYHEMYPNDYYTHYQMGALHFETGDKNNALHEFQTSLDLLKNIPESIESVTVKAQIYAYQNDREKAIFEFERLLSRHPDNLSIQTDYAEALLILKEYDLSKHLADNVLKKESLNYRARRLQSRIYFAQGKYKEAANILKEIQAIHANDLGLQIDLADAEQASGDWYASTEILKSVLDKYPNTLPAQERLLLLRREQNESFATELKVEQQSRNIFKQIYNLVYTKASSSLLHLKLLFGEEKYSASTSGLDDENYINMGVNLSSRYNDKHETSFGVNTQRHQGEWNFSGSLMYRRHFSLVNNLTISSTLNELWNDPFIAVFYQGRKYSVNSDVNLYLLNRIFFWNRLSYERHAINKTTLFGDAFRANLQVGYEWQQRPQFITYYQFYNLNYQHKNATFRDLIPIRAQESIHFLGAMLNQQLTRKLYYQFGGSLGVNSSQNNLLYFGSLDLEYMLMRRIRLRTHFMYGNQSRLTGTEENKSVSIDLNYFN